jgi:hypothetical protein
MRKLIQKYRELLEGNRSIAHSVYESRPNDSGSSVGSSEVQLDHLLFMIGEMEKMPDGDKLDRWMGFIQGVLWSLDIHTLDQLRSDTRSALIEDAMPRAMAGLQTVIKNDDGSTCLVIGVSPVRTLPDPEPLPEMVCRNCGREHIGGGLCPTCQVHDDLLKRMKPEDVRVPYSGWRLDN